MEFEHDTCVGELLGSHLATSLPVTKGRVLTFSSSQVRGTTDHPQTPHTAAISAQCSLHLQRQYLGCVERLLHSQAARYPGGVPPAPARPLANR
jgi:hypothetical protein